MALFAAVLCVSAADAQPEAPPSSAGGARTLEEYRHFRIAAIDLLGRMPTRQEVAAFERPDFDWDEWVDRALGEPAYADRMTRIYMDLLRLEPNLNFASAPSDLLRHEVVGPDGKPVWVYYRENQRRMRPETDGEFCLDPDETGMGVRPRQQDVQSETRKPKPISQKLLDAYTVLVKPWWLYRDYLGANPQARFGSSGWGDPDPGYKPVESLLADDGKPVLAVRVCREEASSLAMGHVFARRMTRVRTKAAAPPGDNRDEPAGGRIRPLPVDKPYATKHQGDEVSCATKMALEYAPDCGCGPGLERCLPGDANNGGSAFTFPNHSLLGEGVSLDEAKQSQQRWFPYWWSREAVHFLEDLFAGDRDFREVLTGKQTFVNGPLAQFYGTIQRSNCCGPEVTFGMLEESEPLFEPSRVPQDLAPQDVSTWKSVGDRGPHAAGLLTMPIFLEKYASARARGAALYNDFLCKSFAPGAQPLAPSTEPNLMIRPGCRACHAELEPMAAYFARVEAASFVFLPSAQFPVRSTACKLDANGRLNGACNALYDAAFADSHSATLRSAYGSPEHADATPAGAAHDLVATPEFAQCAVQRVVASFLGRPTTPDDDPLLASLTQRFVRSGYRMKALVRALLQSDAYARTNDERAP
ncbi:MAG TPA: DUF1549 domain-containing protein [Polyangiaceae bacterium]|nr:DUF1549 domain-containing protein [Polyangiaceae bacterium]